MDYKESRQDIQGLDIASKARTEYYRILRFLKSEPLRRSVYDHYKRVRDNPTPVAYFKFAEMGLYLVQGEMSFSDE
ncbi:MAG: hypothetical protein WC437_04965 [Patescibacteria group bacterium]|jgi:hypothetical protein